MDHFQQIYSFQAKEYQRMIAPEDADGNLLPALLRVAALAGKHILDLGSGTGRIPLLLKDLGAEVVALDLQRAMLREQAQQRALAGGNWPLVQADMRRLPIASGWADGVIAGWSIGHLRGWYRQSQTDWQAQIGQVLREMQRVGTPDGVLIILETLTTGSAAPAPPSQELAEYYAWLEGEWGFSREVIATDYQFESVEQAVERTEFFFGEQLAAEIRANGWKRLPEWTGVWSRRNEAAD
jgi:ubiquinone/menaquinone biosynthesis C-methylase UbiE